ncbi:MFS transporter [Candidatus Woesearchaeota archaeon]|nr:MFS transporter [Candidatus Woesearchaeota archaeon]
MGFFQPREWRLLWPFYLFDFVTGAFTMTVAFFVIFYQGRGLTFAQISFLWIIMGLARALCEIPTGVIADVFGRKFSCLLGFITTNILWILIPFTRNYTELLIVVTLIGAFRTLSSGAWEAWIYDWLKYNKQKQLVLPSLAKQQFFTSTGMIIGPLFGAIVVHRIGIDWVWIIEGAGFLIASLILIFFAREHFVRISSTVSEHWIAFVKTAKEGFAYGFRHAAVRAMFFASVSLVGWGSLDDLLQQPYLTGLSMPVPALGIVWSILAVLAACSAFLTSRLAERFSERTLFLAITALLAPLLGALAFIHAPHYAIGALVLLVAYSLFNILRPLMFSHFNHLLPSRIRATVLSTQSMLMSATDAFILLMAGFIADALGTASIAFGALFMIPAFYFFLQVKEQKKSKVLPS